MYSKIESWRASSILIVGLAMCLANSACNPREFPVFKKIAETSDEAGTRATETAINRDPKLRLVDHTCSAIPLPSDAKFIRKGDLDDQKITIGIYYSSDTPYEVLAVSWDNYFTSLNWSATERDESERRKILNYENETYKVNIQHGGMSNPTVFSFGCTLK